MAPLEIRKAGDPVLKQHCEPVEKIDKQLKLTLDAMAEAMYQNDGVGLAAPQVGLPIRMVVIDCQDDHGLIELINPVITYKEGSMTGSMSYSSQRYTKAALQMAILLKAGHEFDSFVYLPLTLVNVDNVADLEGWR